MEQLDDQHVLRYNMKVIPMLRIVYVVTDDLDHMSIHTTLAGAEKMQSELNNEWSTITEMGLML